MNCPKCQQPMETVTFAAIDVERCSSCRGLWFGLLEHEHLKAVEGAESIDIGDAATGKQFDKIDKIDCPECHTPMIRMVDREQPHIHYESCKVCYGVFFDAGEFRDYKEKTVVDFFRDLFAKQRF